MKPRNTRPRTEPALLPAQPDWKRFAEDCFDTSTIRESALIEAQGLAWALRQALHSDDPEAESAAIVLVDALAGRIAEGLRGHRPVRHAEASA